MWQRSLSCIARRFCIYSKKGIEHKYQSSSNGGEVLIISPPCLEKYFREIKTLSVLVQLLGNRSRRYLADMDKNFLRV
jgi:hypothetical protein